MGGRYYIIGYIAAGISAIAFLWISGGRAEASNLFGDVDCNEIVSSVDAVLILQLDTALIGSLPCENKSDLDEDGTTDSTDALTVLQFEAQLIVSVDPPSVALADMTPGQCPSGGGLSDGGVLANEILAPESSGVFLNLERRDRLAEEIDAVLAAIRSKKPDLSHISPRPNVPPGQLLLSASPSLSEAIRDLLAGDPERVTFVTGHASFDLLNARFGLVDFTAIFVRVLPELPVALSLCFPNHLNSSAAAAAFEALEEVAQAVPDSLLGDGPDIELLKRDETWYVILEDAEGDCPSGCSGPLHFFRVSGETVTRVDEAEARSEPAFVELVQRFGP